MSGNSGTGNGNGEPSSHEDHTRRQATQAEFDAALAAMPDRDRLDKLAAFVATQSDTMVRMIQAQSNATLRMIELLGQRFALLEAEVARLRAQQGAPSEDGGSMQ